MVSRIDEEVRMKFRDKTVIVTGAASGIGKALAHAYAEQGARVVLADANETDGRANAASIAAAHGDAIFVRADVGREPDAIRLLEESVAAFGAIHVLINNAGFGRWKPVYELSVADWDAVLNTN